MMRFCGMLLLLSSCSDTRTVNFAGDLKPLAGVCDPQTRATLTLRRGQIIFAPAEGTLLLHGEINGTALTANLHLVDANKRPYTLSFHGTRSGPDIQGVYETPRCKYSTALQQTAD
jgi:hypothetical protein